MFQILKILFFLTVISINSLRYLLKQVFFWQKAMLIMRLYVRSIGIFLQKRYCVTKQTIFTRCFFQKIFYVNIDLKSNPHLTFKLLDPCLQGKRGPIISRLSLCQYVSMSAGKHVFPKTAYRIFLKLHKKLGCLKGKKLTGSDFWEKISFWE